MLMKFIGHMMFAVTGCSQRNLVMVFTTLVVNSGGTGRGNSDCENMSHSMNRFVAVHYLYI